MRVAHVSDCYLPRTGGIELQVRGLAQAQLRAGDHPEIITATPASRRHAVVEGETDCGVPIHRLAVRLPAQLPVTPHIGKRLRALLQARGDVVHVHGGLASPFAWPALRTAVKAGMPVVVSVHSVWAGWSRVFAASQVFSKWRQWPVEWTAVSEVAAAPLRNALGGGGDVHVLPNGIDVEAWRAPRTPVDRDPDEFVVVAVARMAPRKRTKPLVEILRQTRMRLPAHIRLRAVLIGDGPERSAVERTLRQQGMEWVRCVGWQTHDQIRAIYEHADAFASPALLESFGIAALEARTFGLPVIAPTTSGTAQFIRDGREGLLAVDDAGFSRALFRLATDRELLHSITAHNRSVEPEFAWPNVVELARARYLAAMETVQRWH